MPIPCANTLAELAHDRASRWTDEWELDELRQEVIHDLSFDPELMCQAFEYCGYYVEPALINELCNLLQFKTATDTPEQRAIAKFQTALINQISDFINKQVEQKQ